MGIPVFHGSDNPRLPFIKVSTPGYSGSLGTGVYVALEKEDARFYGDTVYELETKFYWDKVLVIDGDNYDTVEGLEGYSVLVGETVPPFSFWIAGKQHTVITDGLFEMLEEDGRSNEVGEAIELDQVGEVAETAGYKAVYVEGIRFGSSVNEEMLIFDAADVAFAARPAKESVRLRRFLSGVALRDL